MPGCPKADPATAATAASVAIPGHRASGAARLAATSSRPATVSTWLRPVRLNAGTTIMAVPRLAVAMVTVQPGPLRDSPVPAGVGAATDGPVTAGPALPGPVAAGSVASPRRSLLMAIAVSSSPCHPDALAPEGCLRAFQAGAAVPGEHRHPEASQAGAQGVPVQPPQPDRQRRHRQPRVGGRL